MNRASVACLVMWPSVGFAVILTLGLTSIWLPPECAGAPASLPPAEIEDDLSSHPQTMDKVKVSFKDTRKLSFSI